DKHIELIIRQMTRRYIVQDPGDTPFLPGERIDARILRETNDSLSKEGKRTAEGRPELMGITKAAISTDSWLSAASFQETTRVLTEAAIDGRSDSLIGLKENIIIGKVIPAGTGMDSYNLFGIDYPGYVRPQSHTTEGDEGVEVDESVFGTASSSSSSNAATVADFQAVMGTGSGQGSDDAESDADNA
ncbi:MAG: DNA-directed RNA polymerase subunit beta', partial [Actinomycetota bacterium]